MNHWQLAHQEQILRSYQKDEFYLFQLTQKCMLLLEQLCPWPFHYSFLDRYKLSINLGILCCYAYLTIEQSLGQEYTYIQNMNFSDFNYHGKSIKNSRKYLYIILLIIQEYIKQKTNPEAIKKLLLALFFIFNHFLSPVHFLLKINQIQIIPIKKTMNLTLLGILSLIKQIYDLKTSFTNKNLQRKYSQNDDKQSSVNCNLCFDVCLYPSVLQCGHIFCWECVKDAVHFKQECPNCRTYSTMKHVVQLRNV